MSVSGDYAKTLVYINGYDNFSDLSFAATTIGSPTGTAAAWTGLYVEPVSAGGTFTPSGTTSTIDISGITFAGGTYGWTSLFGLPGQNLVLGTPTDDNFIGSTDNDTFVSGGGSDTIDGKNGSELYLVTPTTGTTAVNDTGSSRHRYGGHLRHLGDDTFAVTAGPLPSSGTVLMNGATVTLNGLESVILDAKQIQAPSDTGNADTLDLSAATAGVSVNLATGAVSGALGTFAAVDFENVTGGSGADTLVGSSENNIIIGGDGADIMSGGGGDDTFIIASAAHYDVGETIDGGANSASGARDTIRYTEAGGTLTLGADSASPTSRRSSWSTIRASMRRARATASPSTARLRPTRSPAPRVSTRSMPATAPT